uniref:Uncharacterized protein n=1 Tax=Timema cristinae TaxID=61476 RepID=A0A7R9CGM2_TIMCR|nr:unnamed protein product [Timema cristinae]
MRLRHYDDDTGKTHCLRKGEGSYGCDTLPTGSSPEAGVPDMTVISDIDEVGINRNLQVRYGRDQIYAPHPLAPRNRKCSGVMILHCSPGITAEANGWEPRRLQTREAV